MENVACMGRVKETDSYKYEERREFWVPVHIGEDNIKRIIKTKCEGTYCMEIETKQALLTVLTKFGLHERQRVLRPAERLLGS